MNDPTAIDLGTPRRQSPLAIVFLAAKTVRSIGITQLLVLLFFVVRGAADGRFALVVGLIVIGFGISAALAWWRSTFRLADGEFVVMRGVLRRDRLNVPLDRIQSVSIDQQLLHRITGLVKVTIDTAGTTDAEFALDAIERPVAEALQHRALTGSARSANPAASAVTGAAGATAPVEDPTVFAHTPRRLMLSALTSAPWGALVALAPLFAVAQRFGEQLDDAAPTIDPTEVRLWWLPVIATIVVVVVIVLNVVGVLVQHWQLTLRAGPVVLRRTAGLLSRTSRASSPTRVQVMTTGSNPLQHAAGIRTVGLSSIGEGDLSLIGCDDAETEAVFHLVGVTPPDRAALDRRVERAEIWLAVRNAALAAALVAAAAWFVVGWWSTLTLAVVPAVWLTRRRHVRTFRWSLGPELATRTHVVTRSTRQALSYKANAVRVTQSMFERRRGLGRLHLDTAAGTVSVGMIPIEQARAARDSILHAAETSRRPWM